MDPPGCHGGSMSKLAESLLYGLQWEIEPVQDE
jgi:hypothetical protein